MGGFNSYLGQYPGQRTVRGIQNLVHGPMNGFRTFRQAYNHYVHPAQGPNPTQLTPTGVAGNPTGSVVGYPTQASDESGQMDQSQTDNGSDPSPLATGRIVTKPTTALLGESGPEVVVPLNADPRNHVNGLPIPRYRPVV